MIPWLRWCLSAFSYKLILFLLSIRHSLEGSHGHNSRLWAGELCSLPHLQGSLYKSYLEFFCRGNFALLHLFIKSLIYKYGLVYFILYAITQYYIILLLKQLQLSHLGVLPAGFCDLAALCSHVRHFMLFCFGLSASLLFCTTVCSRLIMYICTPVHMYPRESCFSSKSLWLLLFEEVLETKGSYKLICAFSHIEIF